MKYNNNKISDLKIAYIGGGSRGWAWGFMQDLAKEEQLSGEISLYDIDKKAAQDNAIIGNELTSREEAVGKWNYTVADSLQEALEGSDFAVLSILPGTFDEMESDVHLPERLGIYQSVGDTAGPGGLARALRTIPMYVEIAEAIKKYSPDTWVINYTNPMSLCVKTLYHVFPEIKAFGCCHEVFGTQKLLAAMVKEMFNETEVSREEIMVNVLGINHFTWFNQATYKGIDLFPVYREYIEKHPEGIKSADEGWLNKFFLSSELVKFDLFKRYGLIAAAGDRHLAEFMPGNRYLKNKETVDSWKFSLTPVSWRKEDLQSRLKKSHDYISGEQKIDLNDNGTGEEGVRLIKALCGLERFVTNVNIPNTASQIKNLPTSAVVETNAVFTKDAILPVFAGEIPSDILALTMPHVVNHELILKAALECDRHCALEAMLCDPLVRGRANEEEIEKLLDDMIRNTLTYLPDDWKSQL